MTKLPTAKSYQPWLVCLTAATFFFFEFIQMNMLNAISPILMEQFHLNAVQIGNLSSVYFYTNVAFLFVAGSILDHYSTRRVILIAMALCIIGIILFAVSTSVISIAFSRFLAAIGGGFCFLSCMRLASRWFETRRLGLVIGLVVTMAMTGGMVAQLPFAWLSEHIGWRNTLLINALFGLLIFFAIYALVWDQPGQKTAKDLSFHHPLSHYFHNFKKVFTKKHNWYCGIYASFMDLPIFLLGGLWGIQYLNHVFNLTENQAATATTLLFLGSIIGCPVIGQISDHSGERKSIMLVSGLICLGLILLLMIKIPLSFIAISIIFFSLGFFISAQVLSYPLIAEHNPLEITATATSIVSISCVLGGAIFQPFFGSLMHLHHKQFLEASSYQAGDYAFAMFLFPVTFLIALICAFLIKPKEK